MRDWTPSRPMRLLAPSFFHCLTFKWYVLAAICFSAATFATAQTQTPAQTPFLFAGEPVSFNPDGSVKQEGVVTLLRDPITGAVTLLPATAATFPHSCLPEVMDTQGQFLFGVCGNGLSMYTFDATSGAVQETTTSPYAASTTDFPFLVAPESTGQYVYLLKFSNALAGQPVSYLLDTFQIDRANSQLIPISSQTLPFTCTSVAAVADPNGHGIAVCATVIDPATSLTTPFLYTITFDPTTGAATIPTSGVTLPGTTPTSPALVVSPQGKYLAFGTTTNPHQAQPISYLNLFTMSLTTFQPAPNPATIASYPIGGTLTTQPTSMWFDPLGGLLYVQYANTEVPPSGAPAQVYQVPLLTQVDTLPFDQISIAQGGPLDPDGPYIYEAIAGTPPQGIAVYIIDPGTGFPLQNAALANPFYPAMQLAPLFANYASAGSGQNLTGPFLSQSAVTVTFG